MSERVRLLYVHRWGTVMGGGEIWLASLCTHLDRSRFDPYTSLPHAGALASILAAQNVPIHFLHVDHIRVRPVRYAALSLARMFRTGLELAKVTRHIGAQIIHAFSLESLQSVLIAARLTGASTVVSVLNSGPFTREDQVCFRMVDTIIVNAHSIRSDIRQTGIAHKAIHVIPLGIDVQRFSTQSNANMRSAFGIGEYAPVIGMIGNIEHRKGYDILIRAAARLVSEFPEVTFLVVGADKSPDGQELLRLQTLAGALGVAAHVIFTGPRDDIPEILAAIDIFVLCSRREGLSLAMTEAMAAGKPVVVTPVGGMAEAVEPGRNGILIPPEDPEALAEGLRYLLANPNWARQMGQYGQTIAAQRFNISALVQRTEAVYHDLLARQLGISSKH